MPENRESFRRELGRVLDRLGPGAGPGAVPDAVTRTAPGEVPDAVLGAAGSGAAGSGAAGSGVAAAVLVGLVDRDDGDGPRLVLTERQADLHHHPGEISFPGGRQELNEPLVETALREAFEEIGVARAAVEILGGLPPVDTFVSGYTIYPVVAALSPTGDWRISAGEVERVIEPTLAAIRAGRQRRRLARGRTTIVTDAYVVDDDLIWGATARIIALLLERLKLTR